MVPYRNYRNRALPNSVDDFPSRSIILSLSNFIKILRSIDMSNNPSNLSWSMVERSLVFTRFRVENDRSAEQDVIASYGALIFNERPFQEWSGRPSAIFIRPIKAPIPWGR